MSIFVLYNRNKLRQQNNYGTMRVALTVLLASVCLCKLTVCIIGAQSATTSVV